MKIKKLEPTSIDLVNKVIKLSDNVLVHDGDSIINREGEIYQIDFSGKEPVMLFTTSERKLGRYGTFTEYEMGHYSKLDIPLEELDKEVLDIVCGNKSLEEFSENSPEEDSDETSLVHLKSSDILIKAKAELEIKRNKAKAIASRLHGLLENKYRKLNTIVKNFENKLEKIYKVLYTIELYLGVHEQVIQLVEGDKAALEEPICIRQQILYMDEEIGVYENGGLGFEDIPKFDAWISDNFKKLIPESKCIVVFRIRRNKKDYGDHLLNVVNKKEDMKTYFLMRNGNNLYRIWAPIVVYPRLFPLKSEIADIYTRIKSERSFMESETKKADNLVLQYQRNSLVLQGILDRTDIFSPIPEGTNIFNPETYGDTIQIIYDAENVITDGRKSFIEWQKEINLQIERGSRVIFHHDWSAMRDEYLKYRYFGYRRWYPKAPNSGMYTAEDIVINNDTYRSNSKVIKILFFPHTWNEEAKNRTAFKLEFSDWFILNYDKISLEDLEYFIHSRIDRPNYLEMLPVLIETKKIRLKELAWEKEFVRMTVEEMFRDGQKVTEQEVWDTVNWWKTKVIWKRPITKDDEKALRMIKSKLKK